MVNSRGFAKRLEKILGYYGLSATAFADEINFNRSTISHLVSGRNKPSLEFVMKVSQKFPEVDLDWFVFGKGSFPPSGKKENTVAQNLTQTVEKPLGLFSEENKEAKTMTAPKSNSPKPIDRIVVFYSDGTFNSYQN